MTWKINRRWAGVLLLVVQTGLAASIAAKYAYDRATRPRVWARTVSYDPERPIRGRYLAIQVLADGCEMPVDSSASSTTTGRLTDFRSGRPVVIRTWRGILAARNGVLTVVQDPKARPDELLPIELPEGQDCHRAQVRYPLDFFLPEHAVVPRTGNGEEMWVEVTLPASGPPRPVQLAVSDRTGFHVLGLR